MPLSNSYYKNDQGFLAVTDIDMLTLTVYCLLGKGVGCHVVPVQEKGYRE